MNDEQQPTPKRLGEELPGPSAIALQEASSGPIANVLAEAQRIMALADSTGVPLWLVGGVAIQLHCRASNGDSVFSREPIDIDLTTEKGQTRAVSELLEGAGYRPNVQFNGLNGKRRLLFYDEPHGRQVDVFVGVFEMCHTIPLVARVAGQQRNGLLPPCELLLTKLQIVELTNKDLQDIFNLVSHLDVTDHDESAINGTVVGELCARDWGLWRTCQLNLDRVEEAIAARALADSPPAATVQQRISKLREFIDRSPKTRRWRARARLGDRKRWYELPEEVGGAISVAPNGAS